MTRFKIDLVINDNFYLFAENEAEAKTQALDRIKAGAWPFDHAIRPQEFEIQTIKKG